MTVYLLHFQEKIGGETPRSQAQHYIGWTNDLEKRIKKHKSGKSSPIVGAFHLKGINFEVARTWPEGGRLFEAYLKYGQKDARALCPICSKKPRNPEPDLEAWVSRQAAKLEADRQVDYFSDNYERTQKKIREREWIIALYERGE